jgi:hypothetical protein
VQLIDGPSVLAAGVTLALSLGVGRRLEMGWPAGPAYGFLALVASSNLALFALRASGAPARLLPLGGVAGAIVLVEIIRLARPPQPKPPLDAPHLPAAGRSLYCVLVGLIALQIYLMRTIYPGPAAGISFFQAWNPLYVDASYAAGRFLRDVDMALGPGFMTSTMYYAPNTLGLAALLRGLGLPDAYASVKVASFFCVVLACTLLLTTLRRDRLAMLVYASLLSVYLVSEHRLSLVFASHYSDEILILGGALVCYQLVRPESETSPEARWCDAAVASTFLVFGRNYGAYFSAMILLLCTWRLWRTPSRWRLAAPWLLLAVFSVHELWVVLAGRSLFYPRPRLMSYLPFTPEKLVLGTAVDWGFITPDRWVPSPNGLWLIGLAVILWARWPDRREHPVDMGSLLSPLLWLVLPLSLELVTLYRKEPYSKLYAPSVWLPTWYPAFLLSRMPGGRASQTSRQRSARRRAARWALAGFYALVVGAFLYHGYPGFQSFASGMKVRYTARLFGSGWRETDGAIALGIRTTLTPDEFERIQTTRILYFHYEPGVGLRYYLGGNLFQDYDFWSDPVQSRLDVTTTLEDLLRALGGPNFYLSYGPLPIYQVQVAYPERDAIWRDLARLDDVPYVKRVFRIGAVGEVAAFAEVDPEKLGLPARSAPAGR